MNRDAFSVGRFRERVLAEGLAGPGDFLGCSDEEIAAVVRAQGVVALPALYRDFLSVMGKRPYPLMQGTDWAYRDLLELRQDAAELLAENDLDQSMLDDALVIAMHQGYVLYYIPHASTAPEDPPVWTYVEGGEPSESFATFSEFLVSLEDMRRREVATYRELEASGRFGMSRVEDDG